MPELAAIAIEGAKAVGKTATASRRAATILALNDELTRQSVAANRDLVIQVEPPVFIDEWQLEPSVWERVRTAVDDDPHATGRFLLAGSAGLAPTVRIHSGAGRIVRLTMRPLTIAERGLTTPTVSLRELHTGGASVTGQTGLGVADYVDEILATGFPGIRDTPARGRDRQIDSYLDRILDSDLRDNGIVVRRPAALRAWLRAYAAATSTATDYTKILDAATAGDPNKPSRPTVDAYREHLTRLFILDPIEAWIPSFAPLKRLTVSPKHHLVDPGLAARVVGVGKQGLLVGKGERVSATTGTWLGALFESLAVQSVRTYAELMNARIGHLRTRNGDREIDMIVETNDLDCVALEAKLSGTVEDRDVQHLHWLKRQIGPRLKDAVILNTGRFAYRRPDGIAVVPLSLLGP
ncbi:MAG: ATP-binding protein [Propionibacteriaceae bacterium]|nr:ATP-binding protein [Propionibacteriaceae bacterium]